MGSTKSNMGHPEPASGLAAMVKVSIVSALKTSEPQAIFAYLYSESSFLLVGSDCFFFFFTNTVKKQNCLPVIPGCLNSPQSQR